MSGRPGATVASGRLATLDILRGYFLFVIIIDHFGRFPGLLDLLTGQGKLWASAAEGFFFLSGWVLGMARGRLMREGRFNLAWRLLWQRCLLLYAWSAFLTLGFTGWAHLVGRSAGVKGGLASQEPFSAMLRSTLLLRYSYGWTDYLPHYVVFLFFAPLALWALGRGWWRLVLAASVSLWLLRGNSFDLAWQLLFFSGLTLGYQAAALGKAEKALLSLRLPLTLLSLLVVAWSVWDTYGPHGSRVIPVQGLFAKDSLGPGRLATFFLWFFTLYAWVRCHEAAVAVSPLGRWLQRLGRRSLFVYILSGTLIFAADLAIPLSPSLLLNLLLDLGMLAVVYGAVWLLDRRSSLGAAGSPWTTARALLPWGHEPKANRT